MIIIFQQLPTHQRVQAANSLFYEAQCRIQDPVYGCVGIISLLHQQIHIAQNQLAKTQAEIAVLSTSHAPDSQFQPNLAATRPL